MVDTMVNVNIEIPEELHRQIKLAAVLEGVTLKAYVIETLDDGVPPVTVPLASER